VAELVVGDPPFPVKANNPTLKAEFDRIEIAALKAMGLGELPDLPIDEKRRIKICDLLEMTLFGMGERELGNMLAIPIIVRTREAALRLTDLNDYPLVYGFLVDAERRHMEVLNQREGMTSDR
jgi:5'-deoxynucleotidase YfbR-like HD superfamily hydrolase